LKKIFVFVSILALFVLMTGCSTPLHHAAMKGDCNTVKALLDQGNDVNEKDFSGFTPLIAASGDGQIAVVKMLLDRGADINAAGLGGGIQNSGSYSNSSGTALSFSAWRGHTDVARLLVDRGADIDKAIMILQKYYNTEPAVEFLKGIKKEKIVTQAVTIASKSSQQAPVAIPARERIIVAIFDIHDASSKFEQKVLFQLTNYLSTAMAQTGKYKVIPRSQLRSRLLEEKEGTYKFCFDESCQIELGRAVAAQKSLATTIIQVGRKCAITADLYDLKTETAEKGAMVETDCSEDELMGAMKKIADQL